jgi:integrase-like protein
VLAARRDALRPGAREPVFCGLAGRRLTTSILAAIVRRAAECACIHKHVSPHTLRHTAATWLRQQTGDARLVAAYLGHADLSTVSRYAHLADRDLHDAAAAVTAGGRLEAALRPAGTAGSVVGAVRRDADKPRSEGRAPAPSGSKETAPTRGNTPNGTFPPATGL